MQIRVITKLPNSEQSYKGKVKTHKYINKQNQSTTGKLWNRNDPDLEQAFPKKWWVESDFKAPNLPFLLRLKGYGCHYSNFTAHIDKKKIFWHFCWLPYLYTFSLFETASFNIVSTETEYISTRSLYCLSSTKQLLIVLYFLLKKNTGV